MADAYDAKLEDQHVVPRRASDVSPRRPGHLSMARFRYTALATSGELMSGNLHAASRSEAFERLRREGYVPLQAEIEMTAPAGDRMRRLLQRSQAPTSAEILVFTRELSVLLKAGIPVDRALDNLAAAHGSGPLRRLIHSLSDTLKAGRPLSTGLSAYKEVFPSYYVGLVRAGEAGGTLPVVLDQIASSLERLEKLRTQVRSSLLYPTIVLVMVGASFVVMMVWVIPAFRPLLEGSGSDIPAAAKAVLFLSELTSRWGWLLGLVALAAAVSGKALLRDERRKHRRDRRILSAPLLGDLVRHLESARFCRALCALVSNGVPLLDGIEVAGDTVANRALAAKLRSVRVPVSRGDSLATALHNTGVMPSLVVQLLRVGEESGRLSEMLKLSAENAEERAQTTIRRLVTLMVPLTTLLLGVLVSGMMGVILSAIMSSYNVAL